MTLANVDFSHGPQRTGKMANKTERKKSERFHSIHLIFCIFFTNSRWLQRASFRIDTDEDKKNYSSKSVSTWVRMNMQKGSYLPEFDVFSWFSVWWLINGNNLSPPLWLNAIKWRISITAVVLIDFRCDNALLLLSAWIFRVLGNKNRRSNSLTHVLCKREFQSVCFGDRCLFAHQELSSSVERLSLLIPHHRKKICWSNFR